VDQIGLAVVIPEKAGIDPTPGLDEAPWLAPLAPRIVGRRDIDPLLHHREDDPVLPGMVADRRGPDSGAELDLLEALSGEVLHGVIDDGPVDQVLGMKDRQSRRAVEAGGRHPVVLTDADHVRIGIVGV
jgi:hypothetical protein